MAQRDANLAYVVGVAIGDGNLSNPNGRAVRLRVSCDAKYPLLIEKISFAIQAALPENKVSLIVRKNNCVDVSCYSNQWEEILGWKAKGGPKWAQQVSIPEWIRTDNSLSLSCIRGLIETDGSIFLDRGYKTVNFVTVIPSLANQVSDLIRKNGFSCNTQKYIQKNGKIKHTIRISKNAEEFIRAVDVRKE